MVPADYICSGSEKLGIDPEIVEKIIRNIWIVSGSGFFLKFVDNPLGGPIEIDMAGSLAVRSRKPKIGAFPSLLSRKITIFFKMEICVNRL